MWYYTQTHTEGFSSIPCPSVYVFVQVHEVIDIWQLQNWIEDIWFMLYVVSVILCIHLTLNDFPLRRS